MIRPNKLLKKYDIKEFLKKHLWLILIMLLILVVPIIIYFIIFKEFVCDYSIWANFIAAIISYIGTSILSLFVYFYTWKQSVIDYNNNLPKLEVECNPNFNNDFFCFYNLEELERLNKEIYLAFDGYMDKNDFLYHHIILKNLTKEGLQYVKPLYYIYINKDKNGNYKFNKESKINSIIDIHDNVEYGEEINIYFGINKKHIRKLNDVRKHQVFRFAFEIVDIYDRKFCLLVDCILGQTLGCGAKFVTNSKYLKIKDNFPEEVTKYYMQFVY